MSSLLEAVEFALHLKRSKKGRQKIPKSTCLEHENQFVIDQGKCFTAAYLHIYGP
jgi:hypothetical protein